MHCRRHTVARQCSHRAVVHALSIRRAVGHLQCCGTGASLSSGFAAYSSGVGSDNRTMAVGGRAHRPGAPRRIVLIRHGESEGNVDETAYVRTADWRISLTERGREQAAEAGHELQKILGNHPTMWYVSPYVRTQQTLSELLKQCRSAPVADAGSRLEQASHLSLGIREEPRIAEQQFGNFQNVEEVLAAKEERARFGRFWYRFPSGESGLDVYNRTTSFISTIFRDMRAIQHLLSSPDGENNGPGAEYNVVIVTHGLTLRLFLMRWLRWSVMAFENSRNPPNAAVIVMERRQDSSGTQWFALNAKSAELLNIGAMPCNTCGSWSSRAIRLLSVVLRLLGADIAIEQDRSGYHLMWLCRD